MEHVVFWLKGVIDMDKDNVLSKARDMCAENDAELLYLSLSGSTLYGTRIDGKSDLDVRGVFMPKIESLALGGAQQTLRFSSGGDSGKNAPGDIDIDLWSLQYWLLKLLPSGDTGAVDLLFSPSNASCAIYRSNKLNPIFSEPLRFIDTGNGKTYAEYSMGQAKKYGIKGSHLGALKSAHTFITDICGTISPDERLSNYLLRIVEYLDDERFCKIQDVHDYPGLFLCRKLHEGNTRMTEFARRVESDMSRFGERAREAERNNGLDYKALSHALRALLQMEELLMTGRIEFPLKESDKLVAVKEGKFTWNEIENKITSMLDRVDDLQKNAPYKGKPDRDFAESCILVCYGLERQIINDTLDKTKAHFDSGFEVSGDMLELIHAKLKEVEQTHCIKVLYCCESGSRGWNFASSDSDYDVRFIYIHSKDWYLGVSPEDNPDTLDLGVIKTDCGELDMNGWELRKTLKLLRKSNGALLEKLSSPIVYLETDSFSVKMRSLAKGLYNPLALWHHYRGLMERSAKYFTVYSPSIKTWFYMLRPLLCIKWIEKGLGIPPMRFDLVMNAVVDDEKVSGEIRRLIDLKKSAKERDEFKSSRLMSEYVEEIRSGLTPPELSTAKKEYSDLDWFFRKTLEATTH
jgi:predicted nucleotidyltransferase